MPTYAFGANEVYSRVFSHASLAAPAALSEKARGKLRATPQHDGGAPRAAPPASRRVH